MRILHTADLHLGHLMHERSRETEHAAFLAWLLDTIEREHVDALLVAGDIFDTTNPSASSLRAWYDFLAEVHRRFPKIGIVVIAGNHDSAARLEAPDGLFRAMRFHIIGAVTRSQDRTLDADRLLVPLEDASGQVTAWVAAVPFLRPCDLPPAGNGETDPFIEGVRTVYAQALAAARNRRQSNQALLVMGHAYLVGTRPSDRSERRILLGGQHALPLDVFPEDVTYAALGHLHLAQEVGQRSNVRYSGAPIALALDEASYPHQVVLVDLEGARLAGIRAIRVPQTVRIIRVPEKGTLLPQEALKALEALPVAPEACDPNTLPFLDVRVRLDAPAPGLQDDIHRALEGKDGRLACLAVEMGGAGAALPDAVPGSSLDDLTPEDVFVKRWQQDHEGEPSEDLKAAFRGLLIQVNAEERS